MYACLDRYDVRISYAAAYAPIAVSIVRGDEVNDDYRRRESNEQT
jgi:hypothetical protein